MFQYRFGKTGSKSIVTMATTWLGYNEQNYIGHYELHIIRTKTH